MSGEPSLRTNPMDVFQSVWYRLVLLLFAIYRQSYVSMSISTANATAHAPRFLMRSSAAVCYAMHPR